MIMPDIENTTRLFHIIGKFLENKSLTYFGTQRAARCVPKKFDFSVIPRRPFVYIPALLRNFLLVLPVPNRGRVPCSLR